VPIARLAMHVAASTAVASSSPVARRRRVGWRGALGGAVAEGA
jgi:hypothetical protein